MAGTTDLDGTQQFWNQVYSEVGVAPQSPHIEALHRGIVEMIPPEVHKVLDAGCGGGGLMLELNRRGYRTSGVDLSVEAVRRAVEELHLDAQVGSILDLARFKDHEFDLVICSEVIEHLREDQINLALAELFRVAATHVLITCPYREELSYYQVGCPKCASLFHVVGHIHSVDEIFLQEQLAPHAEEYSLKLTGHRSWRSVTFAKWLRLFRLHMIGREEMSCPVCGHRFQESHWPLLWKGVGVGYRLLQSAATALGGGSPANVIALASCRKSGGTGKVRTSRPGAGRN